MSDKKIWFTGLYHRFEERLRSILQHFAQFHVLLLGPAPGKSGGNRGKPIYVDSIVQHSMAVTEACVELGKGVGISAEPVTVAIMLEIAVVVPHVQVDIAIPLKLLLVRKTLHAELLAGRVDAEGNDSELRFKIAVHVAEPKDWNPADCIGILPLDCPVFFVTVPYQTVKPIIGNGMVLITAHYTFPLSSSGKPRLIPLSTVFS